MTVGHLAAYVECPAPYRGELPGVFLAGGISGCPNWHAAAYAQLAGLPVAVFNPNRAHFPIGDPGASREQIEWEHRHLALASVVLFWFPASGPVPQPIALFELGWHAASGSSIVVGTDPGYIRRDDVVIQLGLARPDLHVYDTLADTCAAVRGLIGKADQS